MIKLKTTVTTDEITDEVSKCFDYEFSGKIETEVKMPEEFPSDFSHLLIVGHSGSGKSTILKEHFGGEEDIMWSKYKAICSHFEDIDEAIDKLSAAGLNSIPDWMKPFNVLSTGQQFRANIARRIKSGAVIDEFTSVVDRDVAKSCSYALHRYIKNNNLRNVVFASCHYDIIEWLQPEYIFDANTGELARGCLQPPRIEVELRPIGKEVWELFSSHHYLTTQINSCCQSWGAYWNGRLVGFTSIITYPSGTVKNAWRGHRTVILPEFQGLGIGVSISDAVGEIVTSAGCRYFSKTAHPRLGMYRDNSEKWRGTSKNHKARTDYKEGRQSKEQKSKMKHKFRICYSHEYIGKNV